MHEENNGEKKCDTKVNLWTTKLYARTTTPNDTVKRQTFLASCRSCRSGSRTPPAHSCFQPSSSPFSTSSS
eukprot:14067680-Heterocapsa_arctica.AAC.1